MTSTPGELESGFLTQVDITGEETVRLLAVDVGVVRVGGLEGSRGVGQEVVEEWPLLGDGRKGSARCYIHVIHENK